MSYDLSPAPIFDEQQNNSAVKNILNSWLSELSEHLKTFLGPDGLRAPQLTTAQRDNIISPPLGSLIYNTTTNKLQLYNNTGWVDVA